MAKELEYNEWDDLPNTPAHGVPALGFAETASESSAAAELEASLARFNRGRYEAAASFDRPQAEVNGFREMLARVSSLVQRPGPSDAVTVDGGRRFASQGVRALIPELVK